MKTPICGGRTFIREFRSFTPTRHTQPVSIDPRTHAQAKIAQVDAERPFSSSLVDSFKRRHDYLRISLTERCNLRCFYCMPSEGVELTPKANLLSNDEILRLATLFVRSGVTKIRLTGGEPTVRKGILEIIARLNDLRKDGLTSIAMTSNGLSLHRRLPQFVESGLTHLNLSLDTLDPYKFEIMTRRMGHDAVLRTLDAALDSSRLKSVKLNVVVVKGLNDCEVPDFVSMTKEKPISVRFIEFMPFTGNKWDKAKMVPSSELLSHIKDHYPAAVRISDEDNDTARSWKIPGYRGSFGFISSMSDHFCATCNRLRITADGQIKVCLFDAKEISLRDEMRRGALDNDLMNVIGTAVLGKQEKHVAMDDIDVVTNRPMILIGTHFTSSLFASRRSRNLNSRSNRWPSKPSAPWHDVDQRRFSSSTAGGGKVLHPLTHLDAAGSPSMVDVSGKEPTMRSATASGRIFIPLSAYEIVTSTHSSLNNHLDTASASDKAKAKASAKGDVLTVAQLAAIMGCKRTSDLIPLCHPLALSHISVTLIPEPPTTLLLDHASDSDGGFSTRHSIICRAKVSCEGKTGVEMEALMAVSVGLLTVWDMLKAVAGKEMEIGEIMVTRKEGGKSGDFSRHT